MNGEVEVECDGDSKCADHGYGDASAAFGVVFVGRDGEWG